MIENHKHSWLWWDGEKIDFNDLKNKPSIWWGNAKMIKFTRAASVWTWNQSFPWFWFTPTHYEITAWRDGDVTATWTILQCMSISWRDANWLEWWVRIRPNWSSQIEVANSWFSLNVDYTNASWSNTIWDFVSLDSDWITLNFTVSNEDIQFQLTCYW